MLRNLCNYFNSALRGLGFHDAVYGESRTLVFILGLCVRALGAPHGMRRNAGNEKVYYLMKLYAN